MLEPIAFGTIVPAIVADTHEDAGERFIEFFAATLRNANTRAAYMHAVADFLAFAPVAALGSLARWPRSAPSTSPPTSIM